MTFVEVVKDIEKLIGIQLESVKPGSGITINSVDTEHGNLQLFTKQNQLRSRPLLELEKIWNELQKSPAVHVDKVLNGSGTSRNQPETILANLPYIEFTKIHGKKHLVFVKKSTHPYGTVKQLDNTESARISAVIDEGELSEDVSVIVVTANMKDSIDFFQDICNGVVSAKEEGIYILETNTDIIAFVTPSLSGLSIGTYPIIEANNTVYQYDAVEILGEKLIPAISNDIRVLIRQK